jgi:hypothetical protein
MIEIDAQLELVARADIPPGQAHVIGVSVAPGGRYAVVMLVVGEGSAIEFDETVAERVDTGWRSRQSGTPSSTIYAGDLRGVPLCNYIAPLPAEVEGVIVYDRGEEHQVPVEQGYFLYVAWKSDSADDPTGDPPKPRLVRTLSAAAATRPSSSRSASERFRNFVPDPTLKDGGVQLRGAMTRNRPLVEKREGQAVDHVRPI